ncbi:hypothetical protein BH11PSE9_BH11PSE9_09240 [soil metagenome]
MAARIFISYRTSDGMDKATALARDIAAVFGDDQVFIDKSDLRGGSVWRQEVEHALSERPVLLLLLTPHLLGATDEAGTLRITQPDDPVRRELTEALAAKAEIIPLLCDGLEAAPRTASLPAPFDQIGERTWRRLRAYDWQHDVQLLVADLQALGVRPLVATAADAGPPRDRRTTWMMAGLAIIVAVLAVAFWQWNARTAAEAQALRLGLTGEWTAQVENNPPFALSFRQEGNKLELTSAPVAIATLPEWQAYRQSWRERTGAALEQVVYRGEGTVRVDPGVPVSIDVAWRLESQPGGVGIDSGNLSATSTAPPAEGASAPAAAWQAAMAGRLWSNADQADRAIRLERKPPR